MMKVFILLAIVASFSSVLAEKARFDNYRIYSIQINDEKQLEILKAMEDSQNGITYFQSPVSVRKPAEMIVPPHKFADVTELFDLYEMEYSIRVQNLQQMIDDEQPKIRTRGTFSWDQYYDLDEINTWLDQMLAEYPDKLTNYEYGLSYENRTLRALKLSSDKSKSKTTIFIESTIHAREWITAATTTYIINEFLTSDDADIKELVNNFDFIFVPVVNVDGYQYTHTTNRMWRKTRQPFGTGSSVCYGADPNRNFDFHHGEVGASSQPCSETYAGPKPNSEIEIKHLTDFIKTVDKLKLYISFHSYSQLLMFPYGHTYEHAANHDDMMQITKKTMESIKQRYGTQYTGGNIAEAIYLASGSSIDWVYGTQDNVDITFVFEFRDKGKYGFLLPADQIIPNSLEILDGLKTLVKEAKALKYL